jgi:importin subunit alpha-2
LCKFGTIASLCSLLKAEEDEIVLVGLDGLANILAAAKRIAQLEKVTLFVEECGGLDRFEELQIHNNIEIYHKSLAILEQYFSMNDNVIISFFILLFF